MRTPNQIHTRQQAAILTARQVRQTQALDHRRDADHAPFTLADLTSSRCPSGSPPRCQMFPNARFTRGRDRTRSRKTRDTTCVTERYPMDAGALSKTALRSSRRLVWALIRQPYQLSELETD
jgi:hypothetical protein